MCDGDTVESTGARAVGQESSSLCKLRNTSNASVFLVELGFNDLVFGGSDRGKDVGFALVVSICANTLKQLSARPN